MYVCMYVCIIDKKSTCRLARGTKRVLLRVHTHHTTTLVTARRDSRRGTASTLVDDDGAQAVARVQRVEGVVGRFDAPEGMRDERVDLELALHVTVDELGHVGARLPPSEGGAHPPATGDQLEGARRDLLRARAAGRAGERRRRGDARRRGVSTFPAAATPMTHEVPQPRCALSSAARMTSVLPVQSNV